MSGAASEGVRRRRRAPFSRRGLSPRRGIRRHASRALCWGAIALTSAGLVPGALASEAKPTLPELEHEVVCPTCNTLLELSHAPVAERMRQFIRERIAAGRTKSEIKSELVDEFGSRVLAAPPKSGANILIWALPLAGIVVAGGVISVLVRRWTRRSREDAAAPADDSTGTAILDPGLERQLDEELARFDR